MLWSILVFVRISVHYNGNCFSETQLSKEEKGSPKTLTPYGYESLREKCPKESVFGHFSSSEC